MSKSRKKNPSKPADPLGIRRRIEDARALWALGRKEGAFGQILIAFSATARKRYPLPPKGVQPVPDDQRPWPGQYARDANGFKAFALDEMDKITGGMKYNVDFPFQGQQTPLEDILYDHLRCVMVHEGGMPSSIRFTPPFEENGRSYSVLELKDPLGFPEAWVNTMLSVIVQAPENEPIFRDWLGAQRIHEANLRASRSASTN